jgi:6-phosphogluconate dehydrogenase
MGKSDIGIIGLGVMGQSLALNFAGHGIAVAGMDLAAAKRARGEERTRGLPVSIHATAAALCAALSIPRKILLLVPAGEAVDRVIADLRPQLQSGDVLVDCGNSDYPDTERRLRELQEAGILYMGAGISGGEEGALTGPSIMPGGNPAAWPLIRPLLEKIATRTPEGKLCCAWVGSGGAGHFVKMVHNGIEYAEMQLIGEAFALLETRLALQPDACAAVFDTWNQGPLHGYLLASTAAILRKRDSETGMPLVNMILDVAGQKGTGKWTVRTALELGMPAQTLAAAVFARCLSALKEERVAASAVLQGPTRAYAGERQTFVAQLGEALYAAKICVYAQGFQLLRAANDAYEWELDYAVIAQLWRAGCIIRGRFLDEAEEVLSAEPALKNLLLAPPFRTAMQACQPFWRSVVSEAVLSGVPIPALSSALAYFDAYRSAQLPANLLQAQRDFFGAHTYERTDKPRGRFFHTQW